MAVEKENGTLEKDNQALVERVAGLQQEKWALEEKLVMLEQSGAAMADELVIKSELVIILLGIWYSKHCIWRKSLV